jgi:cytochrome c-type biogenesis protein CcmH/NrfG
MIRGCLWADAAFAEAAALRWPQRPVGDDRARVESLAPVRAAMETSLALAPVNAEGWLFLAGLPAASGNTDPRTVSLLKLAYLTAPNAVALAPRRLERAVVSAALADPEVQDAVKTDLHHLLVAKPPAREAILAAYRIALPHNRDLLESLVADVDSGFADTLRSSRPR